MVSELTRSSSTVLAPAQGERPRANPHRAALQGRERAPVPTLDLSAHNLTLSTLQTPLSHLPTSAAPILITSITTFSTFLSTTDTLSSPRLSLLPPRFAAMIHHDALSRVSHAYGEMWDAVMDEQNRYEGRTTLLRRSKDEVATLLGVGEL